MTTPVHDGMGGRKSLDFLAIITSHWGGLLVLAVLGQSRVFLWRRVILFDHELDRYAVKLLENESPIDHRVRH